MNAEVPMTRAAINPIHCAWCSTTMDHLCEQVTVTNDGPMHRLCALERAVKELRRVIEERDQRIA